MKKRYRLGSSEAVSAPGFIRAAIHWYFWEKDRPVLREAVATCWSIPEEAVHQLLSKQIPYTVEGEAVVFIYDPAVERPEAARPPSDHRHGGAVMSIANRVQAQFAKMDAQTQADVQAIIAANETGGLEAATAKYNELAQARKWVLWVSLVIRDVVRELLKQPKQSA